MVLMVDNYDSFTYNIVQILGRYVDIQVVRPDEIDVQQVLQMQPERLILSPGPSCPDPQGVCAQLVREYTGPLLGVCLGHQTIVVAFGGRVEATGAVFHGKSSRIRHDESRIYAGVPQDIQIGRYHSLVALEPLPECLRVTAQTEDGTIMGIEHRQRPLYGMQFHPESILSQHGERMLCNFLGVAPRAEADHYIATGV